MNLIRQRRSKPPAHKGLDLVRLAIKGLVAQRVARRAHKTYKFTKRLPYIVGLGAVAGVVAVALKKLSGHKAEVPAAPAAAPAPSPAPAPASATPPPKLAPDPEPATDGAPGPELTADLSGEGDAKS
jgi:hypothetical protein